MKIEIGSTRELEGWIALDHCDNSFDLMFDNFDIVNGIEVPDGSVEMFYMSHVIEHIPIPNVIKIFRSMFAKLKEDGTLRIVCPDLEENAKAYLRKDTRYFRKQICIALGSPYSKLGVGGMFYNTLFSHGKDTYLFDKTKKREIMGIAHLSAYDYDMLYKILRKAGFSKISRSEYDKSIDVRTKKGQLFVNAQK